MGDLVKLDFLYVFLCQFEIHRGSKAIFYELQFDCVGIRYDLFRSCDAIETKNK